MPLLLVNLCCRPDSFLQQILGGHPVTASQRGSMTSGGTVCMLEIDMLDTYIVRKQQCKWMMRFNGAVGILAPVLSLTATDGNHSTSDSFHPLQFIRKQFR
eukprot:TRINITY_DN3200_c0_g1_i1.p2 TRINITY_DN3200_c0_g1~~TRINITY_DN3200_c0_g1_i1.p2  ORF type:complete len:101 (+),score=14.34 TRINITY_DN3200_c0_g1_i1:427-729(+)